MLPQLSPTLKEKDASKWMAALHAVLAPGEEVRALGRISSLRPFADGVAITDRRVFAFSTTNVATKGPLVEFDTADILHGDVKMKAAGRTVLLFDPLGQQSSLGTVRASEVEFFTQQINAVAKAQPPRAPTVDVYDPFTKPWDAPNPDLSRPPSTPNDVPPAAEIRPTPRVSSDGEVGMAGVQQVTQEKKRLVPLWKSIPALTVAGFFGLFSVVAVFDSEAGVSILLFCLLLTLIPLLALTRARHNAQRRVSEASGTPPVYGVFDRNWLPIGIPLAIMLFIGFVALG